MRILRANDKSAVAEAVAVLQNGGVVALPTETVYGLVALWTCADAREKIYELKRRPKEKRLQMLADSLESAYACGLQESAALRKLASSFWPGALTVVAPAAAGESIGLRIPNHPFVLALLKALNAPLAATSANLAGETPGLTLQEATARLNGEPELGIDGGFATVTGGTASTVLSIMGEEPVVLRPGSIDIEDIRAALRQ